MLAETLGGCGGRVEKFRRDGWAPPWPVGLEMLCYMLSHEAHHRGQVCMLAHQLGFPGDGLQWWRHQAPAVGVVVEAPGGGGQKQAPGSHVWKGVAVARPITTHRFELWAVLEAGRESITSHLEITFVYYVYIRMGRGILPQSDFSPVQEQGK